ncbi:hypothetical protein NL676_016185 [Syzygium grande]|nr:hypothetical protein NL676_016185 [Syzygium grande]
MCQPRARFEGMMTPSQRQAALLTFCSCISLTSVDLVLTDCSGHWAYSRDDQRPSTSDGVLVIQHSKQYLLQGHAITRKLNSDGKVDTMQTLHNLNEGELPQFEQAWKKIARKHLPGWSEHFDGHVGRATVKHCLCWTRIMKRGQKDVNLCLSYYGPPSLTIIYA